ncbi:hypothetical protein K458DRAFT_392035 [Lentithecium fluviatile CBS 122367]|uniref:Methyltransferase domain-containing protein n=1 Tax=Lentithecium fluviatile CBS 122367 TaxID=1168545 RepID=A0A6G1ISV7_9PLEO|nr:hypothetical protein K458DRAFT_392035 [Lentithecium fluviatile CBS 122367]
MAFEETRKENVAWFDERPSGNQVTSAARHLLETYSKIPAEQITDHHTEEYGEVLERLHQGQWFLDMACCFGQEIRQLVADGVPPENIYGCDLRPEYIELGYKLFCDRDRLQAKFLTADIFDDNSSLVKRRGDFNMVYTGSFFHLFGYEDQVRVSKAVARLLRPQEGSTIFGRQVGAVNAAEHEHRTNPARRMFRHNPESLKKMWKDIGEDLGVTFSVQATLHELDGDHFRFLAEDTRRIRFIIRRE